MKKEMALGLCDLLMGKSLVEVMWKIKLREMALFIKLVGILFKGFGKITCLSLYDDIFCNIFYF